MEKVEVLVVTPNEVSVKVLNNHYQAFKDELGITSPIDCINRKIGDKRYDFWVDDEGLFKTNADNTINSVAINTTWEEIIAGGIIIANHDDEGNTLSLSDEDIENIKAHITKMKRNTTIMYDTSIGNCLMNFKEGDNILIYSDERE